MASSGRSLHGLLLPVKGNDQTPHTQRHGFLTISGSPQNGQVLIKALSGVFGERPALSDEQKLRDAGS